MKEINPARVVVRWRCDGCNFIRTTTLEKLFIDGPPSCLRCNSHFLRSMTPFRTLINEQHVHIHKR